MKRFIGYISICASLFTAVMVGVHPTILGTNGNSDYAPSRNFVFKISDKVTDDDFSSGTEKPLPVIPEGEVTPLEEVINEFKVRLDTAEISEYKLESIGDNTLSLTFKDSLNAYEDVVDYLTFDNSFMVKDYEESYTLGRNIGEVVGGVNEEHALFKDNSATVQYKEGYPYVVATLKDPEEFKKIVDNLNTDSSTDDSSKQSSQVGPSPVLKAGMGDVPAGPTGGEGEEQETPKTDPKKVLFVLNNWLDGFELKPILSNENPNVTDKNFSDYVLTYFDVTKPESFFWNYDTSLKEDEQKAKTYDQVFFKFYNKGAINAGEAPIDVTTGNSFYNAIEQDDRLAYKKANLLAGKLNSSCYKYQITVINQSKVNAGTNSVLPFVEYIKRAGLVNYESGVLIATAIAFVICALFLLLNYGFSGLIAIITTLGNVVGSLAIFNVLGNEFNIGTILGLLTVVLVSTFTSCIWLSKAKNEVYAGKNLKKAYQEASKKTNMNLLDFSVIGAIVGLTCYLMPNAITVSFGAILLLGCVGSILLNSIVLKGANWLLFNSNYIQNHLKLISVDKSVAADLSHDVKSKYLESFKKPTPKSRFKIIGAVSAILLLASIIGITTFQVTTGNVYNLTTSQTNTKAVVTYTIRNSNGKYDAEATANQLGELVTNVYKDKELKTKLFKNKLNVEYFYYDYQYGQGTSSVIDNREVYFYIDLGNVYDLKSTEATYYVEGVDNALTLEAAISSSIRTQYSDDYVLSLEDAYDVRDNNINLYVLIASSISLGAVLLYFLLRFGPSKALSGAFIAGGILTSVVGIFSLIRGPFPSEITLGILLLSVFAYIVLDVYYTGERIAYKDNKMKLRELDSRETEYDFANNLNYSFVLVAGAIVGFAIMSFFFSNSFNAYTLGLILLGMVFVCVFTKALQLPLEIKFAKFFNLVRTKVHLPKKLTDKKKKAGNNDDGPEEAIFIGIND